MKQVILGKLKHMTKGESLEIRQQAWPWARVPWYSQTSGWHTTQKVGTVMHPWTTPHRPAVPPWFAETSTTQWLENRGRGACYLMALILWPPWAQPEFFFSELQTKSTFLGILRIHLNAAITLFSGGFSVTPYSAFPVWGLCYLFQQVSNLCFCLLLPTLLSEILSILQGLAHMLPLLRGCSWALLPEVTFSLTVIYIRLVKK